VNQRGAPAAYRGYRLQALYTLRRILTPAVGQSLVFQPEGLEDLAIRDTDGHLIEVIQVKSHDNLVLSDLFPAKPDSFFHRAVELLRNCLKSFDSRARSLVCWKYEHIPVIHQYIVKTRP
jgi:hypothetical protein